MLTAGVLTALMRATHPEPAVAVTAASGLLALAFGHPPGSAVLVTATVGASQLAVGWANDAVDADRDRAAGRRDKPVATGAVSRRTVAVAAVAAAATTVLFGYLAGAAAGTVVTVGLVSALAYNWPLKRTALSVVPYTVSFAALPAYVVLALPGRPPAWLLVAAGLLGAGAHFANVLPDLADDAATGVRGLPHRPGPAWGRRSACHSPSRTEKRPPRPAIWTARRVITGSSRNVTAVAADTATTGAATSSGSTPRPPTSRGVTACPYR